MAWHIDTELVCLLLLAVLRVADRHSMHSRSVADRCFTYCVGNAALALVFDVLASVATAKPVSPWLFHLLMSLSYLLTAGCIVTWSSYAFALVYGADREQTVKLVACAIAPYILYVVLVLTNPWTGLLYELTDAPGFYERGALFSVSFYLFLLYMAAVMVGVIRGRARIPKPWPFALLVGTPPFMVLAIALQTFLPGWLTILPFYTVALVAFFQYTQWARLRDLVASNQKVIADLSAVASFDGLTGLYNRLTGKWMIENALRASAHKPCALAIVDLDNLKLINDQLGHPEGDRALKTIASLLSACFKTPNIVVRYGGDEFLLFLPDFGDVDALDQRFRAFIQRLNAFRCGANDERSVRASIGYAIGAVGVDELDTLYLRADKALYLVKGRGKNDVARYTHGGARFFRKDRT